MTDLKQQLEYTRKLAAITNEINSCSNIDSMLALAQGRAMELLSAERVTIYACDAKRNQLTSVLQSGEDIKRITLPLGYRSVAGYTAITGKSLNINDAYDAKALEEIHEKLAFDPRWDEASGFKTKQLLAVPISFEDATLGVLQLINSTDEDTFSANDESAAGEIARILGIALFNQRRAQPTTAASTPWSGLINRGRLAAADLDKAVSLARTENRSVADILMRRFHISRGEVGTALSQFHGCNFFKYDGTQKIPEDLRGKCRFDQLRKNGFAPVEVRGKTLRVVVQDPGDLVNIDRIKSLGLASKLDVMVGIPEDITQYVSRSFDMDVSSGDGGVEQAVRKLGTDIGAGDDGDDNAVVRLVNQIISRAWQIGASDIHIEPNGEKQALAVRMRVDGKCAKQLEAPSSARHAIVSRMKIMAGLDISERRKPQDGKIKFEGPQGELELRVAVLPTSGGEDVVLRLLASAEPIPMEKMSFSERNINQIREGLKVPYGIFLCVGPTGSGKTTTLHSCLSEINHPDRKIWTAEDPIEISQEGLRQVQVHPKIDFTFAAAMRAFLRADPDVIMVGEMRDEETAQIGVEASLTGHLVFSTLHTNSAPETVVRLGDLGVDPFAFADALVGILAQRLARTFCEACKRPFDAATTDIDDMAEMYGKEAFDAAGLKNNSTLFWAKGCPTCHENGFKGRIGLHEYMPGTDALRGLIQHSAKAEELRDMAMQEGMTTLLQDGIAKVLTGKTDLAQVRAVCLK